ncbi:Membrane-bound transcription factor site-2 protease-like protein [Drosera capensis]
MGIGFSTCTLLGVSVVLFLEFARSLLFQHTSRNFNFLSKFLFGFSPKFARVNIPFLDVGNLVFSTVVSVIVHEFGHALAAASEGIQMEYFAVFIAGLFPGALVAFNNDLLEEKSRSTALRIYCAGIWHNVTCCAACGFALLVLPLIFSPLYIHGEGPMVLHVSSSSPVSSYLSPGDIIVSVDGIRIFNPQEWMELATLIEESTFQNFTHSVVSSNLVIGNGRKGYCVPHSLVEKNIKLPLMIEQPVCPDELTAFGIASCSTSALQYDDGRNGNSQLKTMYCLNAADVVRYKECDGPQTSNEDGGSCLCSEGEMCLSPVQRPGIAWVEITYQRPYSEGCIRLRTLTSSSITSPGESGDSCDETFLYVGDMISMAESLWLTSYHPRWSYALSAYLPDIVEKILMCTFHVSLALALLNSLPVYFLDGESMLEVCFRDIPFSSRRQRRIVLQACLVAGSAISCLLFLRTFLNLW